MLSNLVEHKRIKNVGLGEEPQPPENKVFQQKIAILGLFDHILQVFLAIWKN